MKDKYSGWGTQITCPFCEKGELRFFDEGKDDQILICNNCDKTARVLWQDDK